MNKIVEIMEKVGSSIPGRLDKVKIGKRMYRKKVKLIRVEASDDSL